MSRKPKKPATDPAQPNTVDDFKRAGLAKLKENTGSDITTMPHKEWRKLFISGATVEHAARMAETYQTNMRVKPRRRR